MTNDKNLEDKYVEKIVSMGYTEENAEIILNLKNLKLQKLTQIWGLIMPRN